MGLTFSELRRGDRVGPYHVLRQVPGGEGGMAVVYEAKLHGKGPSVAVKISHPELGRYVKGEISFLKVPSLNHPNIIRILPTPMGSDLEDYIVRDPNTRSWYFAMEFLAGGSLADWMRTAKRLPFDRAVQIARQIGSALDVAHQAGIVHLDIKPSNILFRRNPARSPRFDAVLTDFGISKRQGHDDGRTGTLTVEFASPEQVKSAQGDDISVGPPSDIFSFGALIYEMICGDTPFSAEEELTIMYKIVNEPPRLPLSDVPPAVNSVLRRALAKDPLQRFPSAGALATAIESAGTHGPSRPRGRPGALFLGLAGAAVGFAAGLLVGMGIDENSPPQTPVPPVARTATISTSRESDPTADTVKPTTQSTATWERIEPQPSQAATPTTNNTATPTRQPPTSTRAPTLTPSNTPPPRPTSSPSSQSTPTPPR